MATYLIDYENVKSEGIKGITQLSEEDTVVIFYSHNADTITFEAMDMIFSSKAQVRKYKILCGGKNALDFQLSTYLGYLIHEGGDSYFYIISKDNGFKHVVDFWKRTFKYDGYVYCFPTIGDGNTRQQRFKNATAKERQIVMEEELVAMSEELQAQEEQKESEVEAGSQEDIVSEVIAYEDTPEEEDLAAVRRFKTESQRMEAVAAAEKEQQADDSDTSEGKEAGAEHEKAAEKNVSEDVEEAFDRKADEGNEKAAEKEGEDRKKTAQDRSEAEKKTDSSERETTAGNQSGTEKKYENTAAGTVEEGTKERGNERKTAADSKDTAERKATADSKGTAEKEAAAGRKAAAGSETAAVRKTPEPVRLTPIHENRPVIVTPPAQLPESVRRELRKADEAYAGTKSDEKLQEKIQSAVTLSGMTMKVVDTGVTVHQAPEPAVQKAEQKAEQGNAGKEKMSRHSRRSAGRSQKNAPSNDPETDDTKEIAQAVQAKEEPLSKDKTSAEKTQEKKTEKNKAKEEKQKEEKNSEKQHQEGPQAEKKQEEKKQEEKKQTEKKPAKKSVKESDKNKNTEEKQSESKQTEEKEAVSENNAEEISTVKSAEKTAGDAHTALPAADRTEEVNHTESENAQVKKPSRRGRRPKVQKNNAAEFEK